MTNSEPSDLAKKTLRALRDDRCVLISGPPATGKTRLLHEVREAFKSPPGLPVSQPQSAVAIPAGAAAGVGDYMPSPDRTDRRVFETVMHQRARYGQYWRDLELEPGTNPQTTRISKGTLYVANQHALTTDGVSMAQIDELNRGPIVAALGPSLAALEGDKRLDPATGKETPTTATFELPDDSGNLVPYALSAHFYLLGAQNNADVSVEAADVALLRRFTPIELVPDASVLADHLGVTDPGAELPESPDSAEAVYAAALRAWDRVNDRIALGRGEDFQMGHGVFMYGDPPSTPDEALTYLQKGWHRMEKHIREIFFDNPDSQAAVLCIEEADNHPYKVIEESFGLREARRIDRGDHLDNDRLYKLLRAIATAKTG